MHNFTLAQKADRISNFLIFCQTQAAGGVPFSATEFQSSGDAIADLVEDMAAEQKARKTYDNILRLAKDQEVADPIRFLREREIR